MQKLPLENVGSSRQMALEFAEQERRLNEQHRVEKQALENTLADNKRQLQAINALKQQIESDMKNAVQDQAILKQKIQIEQQNLTQVQHALKQKTEANREEAVRYLGKMTEAGLKQQQQTEELQKKQAEIEALTSKCKAAEAQVGCRRSELEAKDVQLQKLEDMYRQRQLEQEQQIDDISHTYTRQLAEIKKASELQHLRLEEEHNNNKITLEEATRQKNHALNEKEELLIQNKGLEAVSRHQAEELKRTKLQLHQGKQADELRKIQHNEELELARLRQAISIESENQRNTKANNEAQLLEQYKMLNSKESQIQAKTENEIEQIRASNSAIAADLARREEDVKRQREQLKAETMNLEAEKRNLQEQIKQFRNETQSNKLSSSQLQETERQNKELKAQIVANQQIQQKEEKIRMDEKNRITQQLLHATALFSFIFVFFGVVWYRKSMLE